MTSYRDWTFVWDAENRLILASNATMVVSNSCDYMSRRVAKVVNGQAIVFTYQGWAMIREVSGTTTNSYVYGLDLSGTAQGAGTIGGILSASFGGTTSVSSAFYCYDANGNVTDLVGTNGEFLAQYQFDPYGNTISKTGTLADANPFRFSTKYLDAETGLYYYGHRFYNPEIGRWASRDPVSPKCNLYTGLLNNPVKYVDGDGRDESYWPPGQNDPPSKVPWPIPTPGPVPPTAPGVYKCCRDIEENSCLAKLGNACGFQHCFLKTSTKAAGMGPEGGTADVLPVCPCGSKTAVIDHAGESSKPGSKCSLIPLIDEDCVNKELDIGKSLGKWSLGNQCNSFVDNIITKCSKGGIFGGVTGGVVQ
jgi:RHS repeat-associated protein